MTIFSVLLIGLFLVMGIIISKADKGVKDRRQDSQNNPRTNNQTDFFSNREEKTTHCEFCQGEMKTTDKFCSRCGEPAKGYVRCGYCGHLNPDTNDLCEKCNGFL